MPRIQQKVEKLRLERGDNPDGQSDDRILADLRKVLLCPDTPALQSKREPRPEMQALYEVQTYLRSNGLIFDDPTLNASIPMSRITPESMGQKSNRLWPTKWRPGSCPSWTMVWSAPFEVDR